MTSRLGLRSDTAAEQAADLSVAIGELRLANPVMPASGCFGPELGALISLERLGALVTKTVFPEKRSGNPAHRLTETNNGMLNSVGIPSPGSDGFRDGLLRSYQQAGPPLIVSVGGLVTEEYFEVTEALAGEDIAAFEVNVSCPNLEHGGLAIGTSPRMIETVVSGVRARTGRPLLIKLTPSASSIAEVAKAAEDAGADAVTVCNSFTGMRIDARARRPVLGNGIGGLTGPAIKPLALRLVHEAAQAVRIPVVGCGGISTAEDAAEFLIAGATAVQVGTATFTRPYAMVDIIDDLGRLCRELGVARVSELTGTLAPSLTPGRS
ncbi:dihydroorotate dehydrogenase [Saccharopolyspora sp. 5N102]|uniref:dihydroorotate dehydrogenase n=1 Tax=Saccharopolyspora sp. 5N102 TaxID=3375155 RepID=UPI003787F0E5